MLVLSRQRNEKIFIGGGDSGFPLIEIQVVDIRGDKCHLGFNVPKEIPVHREEVYQAIQREQERNAKQPIA